MERFDRGPEQEVHADSVNECLAICLKHVKMLRMELVRAEREDRAKEVGLTTSYTQVLGGVTPTVNWSVLGLA